MSFLSIHRTTHYVQPSAMAAPLPSLSIQIIHFSLFIPIFTCSLVQFFLSSWCKDPRLSML